VAGVTADEPVALIDEIDKSRHRVLNPFLREIGP
jgi:MoxR-like ATPase